MRKKAIVVIGSSNTDMIVRVSRIPLAGETILGGKFHVAAGGKGANQAVGAARAGGRVTFIARVGKDSFGDQAIALLRRDGIDVHRVARDQSAASGVALICVAPDGENSIAVASGANAALSSADVKRAASVIRSAAALVAPTAGVPFILNPAPARALPRSLLKLVSILTPNETEAQMLTGIKVRDELAAARAADILRARGARTVILTLGARGAFLADAKSQQLVSGF